MTTHPAASWVYYAASAWAVAFGAPHGWWALGQPAGFPGGAASYHRFMSSSWRYWYDVAVVILSVLGVLVALRLRHAAPHSRRWRAARVAAWIAGGALGLRGIAGMLVDGRADPVWWPTFLLGGALFTTAAWLAPRQRPAAEAPGRTKLADAVERRSPL